MATPDDIKIIAQFLASRADKPGDWRDFEREAFKLRKALKTRGQFRIAKEPSRTGGHEAGGRADNPVE